MEVLTHHQVMEDLREVFCPLFISFRGLIIQECQGAPGERSVNLLVLSSIMDEERFEH